MMGSVKRMRPFGVMVENVIGKAGIADLDVDLLRQLFQEEHLIVLRGFEAFRGSEEFASYCEEWGEISVWPFGKVLELVEQESPEDHIFDSSYVPLHWDGMYREQVPEVQLFHCVHAPGAGNGGQTTFCHTKKVLKSASAAQLDAWSQVSGTYERKMEFYHSKTVAPLIAEHPASGAPVIRYCEPPEHGDDSFVNHPKYAFDGVGEAGSNFFELEMRRALYAPENFYAHDWQTGDVVISDNYTLLHGRNAYTSGAPRHLQRVHVLGEPALDNPHLVFHA